MGRLARRQLGDGIYHVYNRSANNVWILDTPESRDHFLKLLADYGQKYRLNIYHYCLMSNHFHLAIEGGIKDISSLISGVCSRYSRHWHGAARNGYGPIWQGRYKSVIVQKANYLSRLGRYIELNPVRAGIVAGEQITEYRWSSAHCYLTGIADALVDPARHPLFAEAGVYGEQERKLYADYLQVPYQEDIVLFRSKASRIGDENFLSKLVSIGGRIKLRPGRSSKNENN